MGRALAAWLLLLAGCGGSASDEELVWSRSLARSLSVESGGVVEGARFSRLSAGARHFGAWEPYVVMPANARTDYHLANADGAAAPEADAPRGAPAMYRKIPHV